ncbi:L,D-transpeptidase [Trichocoleus sp. FACHB-262]|uniref:L,D-transpeptidase n=1 Tax=Trichocoleus sp. FACHB-262 TaxID=2692869 RepID=UPI001683BC8B|nr:L,D-transpeptidase [Trichocoleus sp. FACHB-262]MBD2120932.1 L,D-transpeptidase [Trichocoleus sp. FACHB-262]
MVLLPVVLFACTAPRAEQPQRPETSTAVATKQPVELVENSSIVSNKQKETYSLVIHRSDKRLEVLNSQGDRLYEAPIGIGQGGLKEKQDMADLVTPTGEMTVDLILYKKSAYNQIASQNVQRFAQNPQFRPLVSQPQGLVQLFQNMSRLDFDGNGSPDKAYGDGYIGLASETTITGPKMSTFASTPYWFSIALHGTPNLKNIGQANSGGCVHLAPDTLKQLIEQKWVQLGTAVKIVD